MLAGFGNYHQTEAIKGTLPANQNSPQQCPSGLYAEQLSGSAFTRTRDRNLKSWLYRILPSVVRQDYTLYATQFNDQWEKLQPPNPMRWSPLPPQQKKQDFIDGLFHLAGHHLGNVYLYQCNLSMEKRYFSNSDGEMLVVPYQGMVILHTEFGILEIQPGAIAVIPRGIKFKVSIKETHAAGYICENLGLPFRLPELGIIGANGLANPRHFLYPHAAFEETKEEITLLCKYQNHWWQAKSNHSPLNVVAWHGNYAPYMYDLNLFNTLNTTSFDHPDPSIFTVLTSESTIPGVANIDFVIFPPRWMVAEHTFRPPYFHRNIMNELMGLVIGNYDAKEEGFEVGGVSLHNCMTGHGPDAATYEKASKQELKPEYYANTLAFMFESEQPWLVTKKAYDSPTRQKDYTDCWLELPIHFKKM